MLDIIRPADLAYRAVRDVGTAPRSATEVADALGFARDTGGPLSVRSGGISSVSTNDGGSVIDLARLDVVDQLQDDLVRSGPGARWVMSPRLSPRRDWRSAPGIPAT